MSSAGRVVLVTGAGSGIGKAIAEEFGQAGARVALAARTLADVESVRDVIRSHGGTAEAVRCDVSDPDQVEAMVRQVRRSLGPVDVLVANAGVPGPAAFLQHVTPGEFLQVVHTKLFGTFLCSKFVVPEMVARGWGRVITMTGAGAAWPMRGASPYGSTNAAVEGLTRNLAVEVERFGVTVNCISPGRVATRAFPINPATEGAVPLVGPEYAARLAVWLASDAAAKITGQTIDATAWDRERPG